MPAEVLIEDDKVSSAAEAAAVTRARPNLRVMFVAESFYPLGGGVGSFGLALARALAAGGIAVEVLTRREVAELPKEEELAGGLVGIRRVPPTGAGRLGKYLMMSPLFVELLRLRRRYDLIYLFGLRTLGPVCVLAGRILGKPCILRADVSGEMSAQFVWERVHGSPRPLLWVLRQLVGARDAVIRRADRLVSISDEIHREYMGAGIDPENVAPIPNGVDVERFAPADASRRAELRARLGWEGRTVFLFTGRLHPIKGVDVLLRAWRRLAGEVEEALLVLVGSGEAEDDLRGAAEDLHESSSFVGQVPDVLPYLQAADAFVLPSRREGFSIALLEAAATGLPVVATRTSGTVEIVTDGETGRLVDAEDETGLYRAMKHILAQPDDTRRMAAAGRDAVRRRYSIGASARRHAALFEQMRRHACRLPG